MNETSYNMEEKIPQEEEARVRDEIGRKRKSASIDMLLSDINISDGRHTPENIAAAPENFQRHFRKLKRRALGRSRLNSSESAHSESVRSESTGSDDSSNAFEHDLLEQLKGTNSRVLEAMQLLKNKLLLALATQTESNADATVIIAARDPAGASSSRPQSPFVSAPGSTKEDEAEAGALAKETPPSPKGRNKAAAQAEDLDRCSSSLSSSSASSSESPAEKRLSMRRRRASRTDILLDYMTEECGDDLLHSNSTMDVLLVASKLSSVAVREARKIANRRSKCLISLPRKYFDLCQALGFEFDVQIEPLGEDGVDDGGSGASTQDSASGKESRFVTTDLLSVYAVIKRSLEMMRQAKAAKAK